MSCWLLPSAHGACGALCCRSAAPRLGRAAPTRSPTPARRVRPHRRLPRRRTLHYPLAGTVFGPAGPPLAPGADPAATAVPQAPLPARLPEPVPRGRRLDLLAAVLPHRLGPARPAPDHPGPSWCAAPAPRRSSSSTTRCWQSSPATSCCEPANSGSTRPWWRPTSTIPPTPTCSSTRSAPSVGWSAASKQRGAATRTPFRDRSRAAGRRLWQISRTLRRRTGQAPAEIDRLTAQVAQVARRTLAQAERIARNARRARAKRPDDGRLRRLIRQLEETAAATHRLLDQTRQRLRGTRVIPDRLVSLCDPDARPIRKGKPHKPTEFGYTVLLAECERGFITTHHTHKGNPSDAAQLVGAVTQVIAIAGRPPGAVAGDRGFGTAANDTALAALGSTGSGCHARAPPARPDKLTSRPDRSNACATGGWESRPASASSNAPSGYGAPGCAAWPARRPGSGWGSSPTTCSG